jgi:3-keto-5-aminohexanoate cleavage enzyme
MRKLIITVAVTGSASPEDNPYLPKTPKEQIQATVDAWNAGASVVHLHARNPLTGKNDHKAEFYAEAIAGIRAKCDIVVNVSTGGEPKQRIRARTAVIPILCKHPETKPELASLNAGAPIIDTYSRSKKKFVHGYVMQQNFPDIVYAAELMKRCGVKPELECYDVGMINNCLFMKDIGALLDPLYFQFVMGVLGQIPATVDNLSHMARCIPQGTPWSVCAVGLSEFSMGTTAMLMGGNVRVGLEDNIYVSDRVRAKSNAELVKKWYA